MRLNKMDQTFGDRVLILRKKMKLSQAKLAAALKERYPEMRVTDSAVHTWEKLGKVPVGQDMANLAAFFDVEPAYLQFGLVPFQKDDVLAKLFSQFVALTPTQKEIVSDTIAEFSQLNSGEQRTNNNN